jgi:ribosomal protein S5
VKTTVEIPDSLLREAKRLALREHTTVRALIERGLRTVVDHRKPGARFTLRPASFRGDGLTAGTSLRDWDAIGDLTYKERGA